MTRAQGKDAKKVDKESREYEEVSQRAIVMGHPLEEL